MPVFSFTAPHITPEEEIRERESLSEQDKRELEHDLYGYYISDNGTTNGTATNGLSSSTSLTIGQEEELLSSSLSLEDTNNNNNHWMTEMEALIEKAPNSRKKDYLTAKQRVPFLIEKEASPIKFLRCEKFNVVAATNRMLLYWKTRRRLFGDLRAFLPLTLSGAMLDDQEVIESGILSILPCDQHGRGVLFMDRIRAVPPIVTRDASLRAVFYFLHIMSEDEQLQRKGYVCLVNFKGYDLYKHFDRILTKQNSLIMLECMPIKIKAEHLLTGSANGVMSLVLPVRKHVVAKDIRLRMVVHTGTDEKILESFKPYGLSSKNIGHVSGGDFKHDDFLHWLDIRRALEEEQERELEESIRSMPPAEINNMMMMADDDCFDSYDNDDDDDEEEGGKGLKAKRIAAAAAAAAAAKEKEKEMAMGQL